MPKPADRCPRHHCRMIQVSQESQPRCVVEWLQDRCAGQRVIDIIPPDHPKNVGDLVFSGGLVLPIRRMLRMKSQKPVNPLWKDPDLNIRLAALTALQYKGVRYLPNENRLYLLFGVADLSILAEVDLAGALNELLGEESDRETSQSQDEEDKELPAG